MKKQYVSLLVILLATSGILFSCGNKMNKNKGALEFDSIQINEVGHLFGDTAKPGCNINISFAYASKAADKELMDNLNSYLLSVCFGGDYATLMPKDGAQKYKESYIKSYREELEPMYATDEAESESPDDIGMWYSYFNSLKGHVNHYKNALLVYRVDHEEYTGGAHGTYASNFFNINLNTMTIVRLDDIFVDEYKEMLTDLLWNQLIIDNEAANRQELEEMGYSSTGDLEPTENFYLSDKGITFYYNIYEIAPYVMGATKITLPYEIIAHLLSDDAMILKEVREDI